MKYNLYNKNNIFMINNVKSEDAESPVTKHLNKLNNSFNILLNKKHRINIDIKSHQGIRDDQQDRAFHLIIPDKYIFSGILDGHGGSEAADYIIKYFEPIFMQFSDNNIEIRFQKTIDALHNKIIQFTESGTTLCWLVIDIKKKKTFIANIGDSYCIIVSKSGNVTEVTKDHKPSCETERKDIIARGGHVTNMRRLYNDEPRVNGYLSMSRSIGDNKIENVISHIADLTPINLENINRIIICSDGANSLRLKKKSLKTIFRIDRSTKTLLNLAYIRDKSDNTTIMSLSIN